jgi:ProP effector
MLTWTGNNLWVLAMKEQETAKKERLQTIDWLIEYFPAAFFKQARDIKPLKIGIFDEIIEFYDRLNTPPFSKKKIREALNYYSASPGYLNSQKTGAARIDLYGNEVDIVTDEQAKYAYHRFQERYAHGRKNKPTPSAEPLPSN